MTQNSTTPSARSRWRWTSGRNHLGRCPTCPNPKAAPKRPGVLESV